MRDKAPPLTEQTAWDHLRVFVEDFAGLFGKPIELARRIDLPKREYEVCTAWLRALEAWLRRLLLIAASRVMLAARIEAKKRPPRTCPTAGARFPSEDSSDWRVSFQLTARTRPSSAKMRSRRPRRVWKTVPLALRFEALLRAARDPDRHVQRMTRLLAKNARLPNALFRQRLQNMSALRPYVAQCSFLVLEAFPEAWRPVDSS